MAIVAKIKWHIFYVSVCIITACVQAAKDFYRQMCRFSFLKNANFIKNFVKNSGCQMFYHLMTDSS